MRASLAAYVAQFGQIGVGPGKTFKVAELDAPTARGLRKAIDAGQRLIMSLPSGRPVVNGWLAFSPHTGKFGNDYRYRAYVAKTGLAANDPEEAHFSRRVIASRAGLPAPRPPAACGWSPWKTDACSPIKWMALAAASATCDVSRVFETK